MGIINKGTTEVRPTQDYLRQETINYYLKRIEKNKPLLPVPAVESVCFDGKYDALDGHHNLAVSHAHVGEVVLWVPESPKDFIPYSSFPGISKKHIDACNEQIFKRFEFAPFYVPSDNKADDILTIDQLINHSGVKVNLL